MEERKMRKLNIAILNLKTMSIIVAIVLSILSLNACNAAADPGQNPKLTTIADQQPIQLSEEQRRELNTFFSNFSEASVGPFANGQISDDELIRFGLLHIIKNRNVAELMSMRDQYGGIPLEEVDYATNKYFDKVVSSHRSIPYHEFVSGHYMLFKLGGDGLWFSQIQSLYDNKDGTYTAIVDVYSSGDFNPRSQIESVYDNGNGSYTVKGVTENDGRFLTWEDHDAHLQTEWKAIFKPVYEGDRKRYILLEYLIIRQFTSVRDGKVYYLPRDN
jgi:hypothetical protein